MAPANPLRGEATLEINGHPYVLRPSFQALVTAEEELGSLFALVERAAEGKLRLAEIATLFWHCTLDAGELTRDQTGEAVMRAGLVRCAGPLRILLGQILQGNG